MPYSGPDDDSLPKNVQDMDEGDRKEWVAVWNDVYQRCIDDGGETQACEVDAFKQANGKLKKESSRSAVRELWAKIRALFEGELGEAEPEPQRAVSMSRLVEQLFGQLEQREDWAWPVDVYADAGELYAVLAQDGKLYRVALTTDDDTVSIGEWVQVMEVHQPVGQARTLVHRQADGRYRWLSVSATATLNRVAEIDSRALFDAFVAHAEATGEYPKRDFFHLGDACLLGQCDFLARDDNVLLTSGVFDDTPLGRAAAEAALAEPGVWGDSIAYQPTVAPDLVEVAAGVRVPVYTAGVLRYISTLPEDRAASLFTATTVTEVTRMRQEVKDALARLKAFGLTDDDLAALEEKVDGTNRAIADGGIVTRDGEPPAPESPPVPPEGVTVEGEILERTVELDEETLAAVVEAVLAHPAFSGLSQQLETLGQTVDGVAERLVQAADQARTRDQTLETRLAALEQDDDDKRRRWQADLPRRQTTQVSYRPRTAKQPPAEDGRSDPALADIAAQTLAAIPKAP